MFIRLSLIQKILQIKCNRFKPTTQTRCWCKSNTTINFTGSLERAGCSTVFFIIEEAKETDLDFSTGTVKVL